MILLFLSSRFYVLVLYFLILIFHFLFFHFLFFHFLFLFLNKKAELLFLGIKKISNTTAIFKFKE
jgi:hypothetical protein